MKRVASIVLASATVLGLAQPAGLRATSGPITTPTSALLFYQQSVNRGLCAQAFKFSAFGDLRVTGMRAYMRQCAAIKHLAVKIVDPGYRIPRLDAHYTCLGVQFTSYLRNGTVTASGGWYVMEKTPYLFWHALLTGRHLTARGKAMAPSRAVCVAAIPAYAHFSTTQIIAGSDFLSADTGWIALSRSNEYVLHGSCEHGIGATCNSAQTAIYRTDDGGAHWQRQLTFTMLSQPPVWIHFFDRHIGVLAANTGPIKPSPAYYSAQSILFRTTDGGKHWARLALPIGYSVDGQSLTFPDPEHGWLYYGGAAMGSMTVNLYHTTDGGRHWRLIACTPPFVPGAKQQCQLHSGINLGGDKEFLSFSTASDGWITIVSNSGIPALDASVNGGKTWHVQGVGLPPGVSLPLGPHATVFPMGTLDAPHLFGREGVLAEMVNFYVPRTARSSAHLYLFQTHDAGHTWQFLERSPVPIPSQVATILPPWIDQYLNAGTWFFPVGHELWQTATGGKSWSHAPMRIPGKLLLNSLTMIDTVHGWATAQPPVENGGLPDTRTVLRTTDGGRVWQRVQLPRA